MVLAIVFPCIAFFSLRRNWQNLKTNSEETNHFLVFAELKDFFVWFHQCEIHKIFQHLRPILKMGYFKTQEQGYPGRLFAATWFFSYFLFRCFFAESTTLWSGFSAFCITTAALVQRIRTVKNPFLPSVLVHVDSSNHRCGLLSSSHYVASDIKFENQLIRGVLNNKTNRLHSITPDRETSGYLVTSS